MSRTSAEQVVADTVRAAQTVLGDEIAAIYTLGSLAHGGFAPLVSDVDVAIVLTATAGDTAARIAEVKRRVVARASSPLANRLSLFWGDWPAVRTGTGAGPSRLNSVDRLDLLDSGQLLVGSDLREPSVRPTRHELVVMSADFILAKFSAEYLERLADVESLLAGGVRAVTKAILFPVRFTYTARTGQIGLNDASAGWYAAEELPGSALALKALDWRNEDITDDELALRMLDADLATIHAECVAEYARELDALGETRRATVMTERAALIHVPAPDAR
jgi:hypothetical protein